jgi:integrase
MEGVHGPYKHRLRWRVIEVAADGRRSMVSFESEREARDYIREARQVAHGRTIGEAVTAFLDARREEGANGKPLRASTVKLDEWRLLGFLRLPLEDGPLTAMTRAAARKLLEKRKAEVKVDTLVGELSAASRWARWCRAKGWLPGDPFEDLRVVGERSAGKPQLRTDGARAFLRVALEEESREGLAAAMALLMGMRASEITNLTVADVDDGARVVWITRAKTRRGERRLEVPSTLVGRLWMLSAGRDGRERLFGDVDRHWLHYHVVRLCDRARLPRVTPHGLRGTWATLSMRALPTEQVAAALGHDPKVTISNYAEPGSEESAASKRLAGTLNADQGGNGELPN